jgi:hypothetical protein
MLFKKALALSMLSSALLISACEPKRVVTALPIPPERTDCQAATGKRPTLPPEFVIDWSKVATVGQAKAAHENFVNVIRGREGIVANYVLQIEGDLHQCSLDAQWIREVQAETTR